MIEYQLFGETDFKSISEITLPKLVAVTIIELPKGVDENFLS
jgi:hypothetical protein